MLFICGLSGIVDDVVCRVGVLEMVFGREGKWSIRGAHEIVVSHFFWIDNPEDVAV